MGFRQWLIEKWAEHCTEHEAWCRTMPNYTSRDYFNKYKWWLRREYRHQVIES
jgi:hypothetical protein